ncbi:MAG: hypothetical protein H0W70_10670 [Actinobacteria bacterium]|nr:hypothetical protein [Actinomycetota bacterium]
MTARGAGAAAVLAAMIAVSACGRFTRAGGDAAPTTTPSFTTLPPLATTTTVAGRRPTETTAVSAHPADPCAGPSRSSVDDPSGYRLVLTVGTKRCYRQAEDFTLTFEIKNLTAKPLYYAPNQDGFFDIIPEGNPNAPSWNDRGCRTRGQAPPGPTGAFTLAPGETATRATAVYPSSKSEANREQCRTLDGNYAVFANLASCTDETCATVRPVRTDPVRIQVH